MDIKTTTHEGNDKLYNEDRLYWGLKGDRACLLAVADGMGGQTSGDEAAALALEGLEEFTPDDDRMEVRLAELTAAAHARIMAAIAARPELHGMGTTLVMAYIQDDALTWASVGDSRCYLYRQGRLTCLTRDHNLPGRLLQKGKISEDEAFEHPLKNMLMRCLGCEHHDPDTGSQELAAGDLVLLCSDGLHDELRNAQIADLLSAGGSLAERLARLQEAALTAGGADNITIVGVQL